MKKFLTKKATMIGSIVAAAVVFILLLAFCVRPVSVGYTYSGELDMGGAKFTAKAHINSFDQMTLTVLDEDGEPTGTTIRDGISDQTKFYEQSYSYNSVKKYIDDEISATVAIYTYDGETQNKNVAGILAKYE